MRKAASTLNQSIRHKRKGEKIGKSAIQDHLRTTTWGKKAYKSPVKPILSKKNNEDRKILVKLSKKEDI